MFNYIKVSLLTSLMIYLIFYFITFDPLFFSWYFDTPETRGAFLFVMVFKYVIDYFLRLEYEDFIAGKKMLNKQLWK